MCRWTRYVRASMKICTWSASVSEHLKYFTREFYTLSLFCAVQLQMHHTGSVELSTWLSYQTPTVEILHNTINAHNSNLTWHDKPSGTYSSHHKKMYCMLSNRLKIGIIRISNMILLRHTAQVSMHNSFLVFSS